MSYKFLKSFVFFITILFAPGVLLAQYYLISFSGSGQSNSIDSIQVENLSQGTKLSLNGDDDLLLFGALGIHSMSGDENPLHIYPNPMTSTTNVEYFLSKAQLVSIEIFNEMGVMIANKKNKVGKGQQRINISGLKTGIYMINVRTTDLQYSSRVISVGSGQGKIQINHQYLGNKSGEEKAIKYTKDLVQMQYNDGEMILFKGFSGNYARVITLLPNESQTVNFEFINCMDEDENHYAVVSIGTQTWMAENLKTTKFNDGTDLPLIIDNNAWSNLSTSAYCWYNNDMATYANVYGALYNWYSVETGMLCPVGWHVPSHDEWTTLANYLGSIVVAGGKLKETGTTHWNSPNTGASNHSGFTGLPGGDRYIDGIYGLIGETGFWWTTSEISTTTAWGWYMLHTDLSAWDGYGYLQTGLSVRCLKDQGK